MCVCTILSGSRSLTEFKVDEDWPNKNSRHLRTLSLNYLSAVLIKFLKIKRFNKLLSRSRRLFVLMKLHTEGSTSALPV